MDDSRRIRWGDRVIDTDTLLESDRKICSEYVVPLTKCLLAHIEGLDPEFPGAMGIMNALDALEDNLLRIAAILMPDQYQLYCNSRRIHESMNHPRQARPSKQPIPRSLRKAVFDRDGYRCLSCGGQFDLCADHVYPESKGGPTTLENLQTLCRPCNSRKKDRE